MTGKDAILIVDDDESTCRTLTLILQKNGYQVEAVRTGRAAVEKARGGFFNAALVDIRLPDMEGTELLGILKRLQPDMAVQMVTGYASVDNVVRALNQGATTYHTKPLNLEEVLATLGQSLERQRLITEKRRAEKALLANRDHLCALASELSRTEERQRRRIAENLHDGVGQALALIKMKLEDLKASESSTALDSRVNTVLNILDEAIEDTHSLTFDLGPPILYQLGFGAALEWLADDFRKRHELDIAIEKNGPIESLDLDMRVLLFRAVRELLTNVVKHAKTRHVEIGVRRDADEVRVTVADDGVGLDTDRWAADAQQSQQFGLFSIRERLTAVGGRLDIQAEPGHGCRVTLVAPLSANVETQKEAPA